MYLDGKEPTEQGFPVDLVEKLRRLPKKEFLKTILLLLAEMRAQGRL
jgi:hypothetical protein